MEYLLERRFSSGQDDGVGVSPVLRWVEEKGGGLGDVLEANDGELLGG